MDRILDDHRSPEGNFWDVLAVNPGGEISGLTTSIRGTQ